VPENCHSNLPKQHHEKTSNLSSYWSDYWLWF